MKIVEQYLLQLNIEKRRWRRAATILTALSLVVAISVSWSLRMTGITLANGAGCGKEEHQHSDNCPSEKILICGYPEIFEEIQEESAEEALEEPVETEEPDENEELPETEETEEAEEITEASEVEAQSDEPKPEHVHTDECYQITCYCELEEHIHEIACYPDPKADIETPLDWQNMFKDYPYTGDLREDLVGIAKTQVGYTESVLNFEVGNDGIRRGYTRYGEWYGAPYNDWSAIFASFCLNFAGADLEKYPNNSGANTMAELWEKQGKYVPFGEYVPISGDLIFFNNNTVGIVAEVQNATIQVICGNIEDSVKVITVLLTDDSIAGWGIINKPISEEELLDISNGPAFFIFEGENLESKTFGLKNFENIITEPENQQYSVNSTSTVIDLLSYLEANGGSYFFTLLDNNNVELPKNENGQYIAVANESYKLTISFNSPNGFLPGTYQYQIPNGLLVNGGEGSFVLNDGVNVGSWVVTDTGLITLDFNENINSRTDIVISSTLGIHFPEQEEPIDFDGKITVTIEKPADQLFPTELYKWGQQGGVSGKEGEDPSKIYWTLQIVGHADSNIPGNILSDEVLFGEWSKDHRYTESDIAGGLTFGVSEPDPITGEYKDWHSWSVSPDDPHLIWTETGWSYKMPKTATCIWCGEIELGNENWIYTVNYTSTPDKTGVAGTYGYENQASIDGQQAYAWTDFTQGEALGDIFKTGTFISDASGGSFLWEFQAVIPGRVPGEKAEYHWYVMDYMYLLNSEGHNVGQAENDAHLATVTTIYNGQTINVPRIQDATENDMFAWDNAWTANNNGINYGREFNLLCRCQCNESNCRFWNGQCGKYWYEDDDGEWKIKDYCQCWTPEETLTFTFVYRTKDLSTIENYGGLGYKLQNIAELHYMPNGGTDGALVSSSTAVVTIPDLFKKELTSDFNGYTAHYRVTVNEAKVVLTNGTPLTIHDEMTQTLAYISGSIVITTEDANGNRTKLRLGDDFTVSYDGTGDQTDKDGNKVHVLDIVILRPQPVMYILDYDTTLIMPDQFSGGVKYSNSATISLWGEDVTDSSVEKVYADINISAKKYNVELRKTCAVTKKPLPGAKFGLYNAQGGLISTGITNAEGKILFETDIINGIILREHVLYYVRELEAPLTYQLDSTQHWFCFCDKSGDYCETCKNLISSIDAVRIPFEQLGKVNVENQPVSIELPATGGSGIYPYILCGLSIMLVPLVYGFSSRRKCERRSQ